MAAPTYPDRLPLTPVMAPVHASVSLPGSKSITNRALLLAALADGQSRLLAPLHSDDTFYMAQALRGLGVRVEESPERDFLVSGTGGRFQAALQAPVHRQLRHHRALSHGRRLSRPGGYGRRFGWRGPDAGAADSRSARGAADAGRVGGKPEWTRLPARAGPGRRPARRRVPPARRRQQPVSDGVASSRARMPSVTLRSRSSAT